MVGAPVLGSSGERQSHTTHDDYLMSTKSVTGPQLFRLQYLLEQLRDGAPLTTRVAAEHLEVSRRTIANDVEYLRQIGVPLEFDQRRKTYYLTEPFGNLPLVALQRSELAAFLVARFALEAMGDTATANVLRGVVDRLAEHLPSTVRVAPEELRRSVRFSNGPRPPAPTGHLQQLQQAIEAQRVVRIQYYVASRDEESDRHVEPYALLAYSGAWYLIAWCRVRKGMRDFRVDRIAHLEPTRETFARRADFDLDAYLGPAFSVFHGEAEHTVRLRFSPFMARWIREGVWHESQILVDLPDGSLELQMTVRGFIDVVSWVLSFGGECEVLQPPVLRERVAREANRLIQLYADVDVG